MLAGSRSYLSFIAVLVVAGLAVGACGGEHDQAVDLYGPHNCYRTLAEVDCHETALPGEEGRAVGHHEASSGRVTVSPEN